MPLFENNPPNQETKPTNNSESNQTKPTNQLITTIGQLLPLVPFAFEQITGQKVPPMTGTMAEMKSVLMQIQTNLQVIVNNQQQLAQRLIALETSAGNQLTNLTHQFNSLRLTHTKEKKEIAYNNPESDENY